MRRKDQGVKRSASRFLRDESGATAVEYGLLAVLIAVALIGVLSSISTGINTKLQLLATTIKGG